MYNVFFILFVINIELNKYIVCILIIIMVVLYNENLYLIDIIIFFYKVMFILLG